MCIIQDDETDKLRELAKMHEVYNHSSLTLCASGARWCTENFFNTARVPGTTIIMPDIGVNYPVALPNGQEGYLRLIEHAQYHERAEALTSRGWTYQEEMLPVSVVKFGACLSWQCDELSEHRTAASLTGGIDSQVSFSTLFVQSENSQHKMRNALQ